MKKWSRTVMLILAVMLLTLAGGGVGAQETPAAEVLTPEAVVAPAISYQGRLIDPATGDPLTGTFDFAFTFWNDPGAGSVVSGPVLRGSQAVTNGYYRTTIEVDADLVTGQALWLEIWVRETGIAAWDTLSPRVEVLPVMYAMTVRPGARVVGAVDKPNAVINATSTSDGFGLRGESTQPGGFGVVGYNGNVSGTSTFGAGVKGGSIASGYGVLGSNDDGHGIGVAGVTQDGYGVRGSDYGSEEARGYGGYFQSFNGVGAYGWSGAGNTWNNMYAPGLYGRSQNGVGVYGRSDASGTWRTAGVMGWGLGGPGGQFYSYSGNVIEGWEDQYTEHDMNLNLVFKVHWNGSVYADVGYYTPAADLAEMLPAQEGLEPGDVLVIGPDGQLARASQAYQPTVVGVYSTQPGFLGGVPEDAGGDEVRVRQGATPVAQDKSEARADLAANGKVPLAIAGVVPVKASAENGAITPGALLVAAGTPGHCMLAGDNPPVGTVLGKALAGLESGTGIILMLVMLQ